MLVPRKTGEELTLYSVHMNYLVLFNNQDAMFGINQHVMVTHFMDVLICIDYVALFLTKFISAQFYPILLFNICCFSISDLATYRCKIKAITWSNFRIFVGQEILPLTLYFTILYSIQNILKGLL